MKKKKTISMMAALLLTALIPMILTAFVVSTIGCMEMTNSLEEDVFHEVVVAAEGLKEYYEWDIVNLEDHTPAYEHDYVDGLLDNDIQLTLFLNNVRYITSLKDASNPSGRMEGTTASDEIWSEVSKGVTYNAKGVTINGAKYYVTYIPVMDASNKVIGMAFAGKEEKLVQKEMSGAVTKLLASAVVMVIICSIVVLLIAKRIKEPLEIIAKNIQLLSEGELKPYKVAKSNVTEIYSIIESRKVLSSNLQDIIAKVQNSSNDLLANGNNLQSVAANTSDNAEDISHAVEEMAEGVVSMAGDIDNATEKVGDMGRKIEGIVSGIEELDKVALDMDKAGRKAMEIINVLAESNNKTVEAIEVVAKNVEATDHSVADISGAVNLITEIADQTNLLALNASIEAARAGEAGKGFAVVANEISSLAEQSSESAKKIEVILSALVSDSKRSIEKMDEVNKHLQEQQEHLKNTQNEFANVNSGIQNTRKQSDQVDGQAKECDAARLDVIDIISSLSAIAKQNAASTQETRASIEELTSTINHVAAQADGVKEQAELLEEVMKFFKSENN